MKNQTFSPTLIRILLLLVICALTPFSTASGNNTDPVKTLAVFVNGHQVPTGRDSLEITAKGFLTLSTLTPEYDKSEHAKFKVVVRSTKSVSNLPIMMLDKRIEDGKEFEIIDLQLILMKANVGDTILIIPVDKESKFGNSKTPFELHVVGDRC